MATIRADVNAAKKVHADVPQLKLHEAECSMIKKNDFDPEKVENAQEKKGGRATPFVPHSK